MIFTDAYMNGFKDAVFGDGHEKNPYALKRNAKSWQRGYAYGQKKLSEGWTKSALEKFVDYQDKRGLNA